MERRMRGNSHVRCGAGEKMEIISNSYLSPSLGGTQGQATDIQIAAQHIIKTKEKMNRMLSEFTGQPYEKVCQDTERDNWLDAEAALAYGLVDDIMK